MTRSDAHTSKTLPQGAVIRVSTGHFDPSHFVAVDALIRKQGEFLVPAIQRLPGLIAYYSGTAPEGVTTQVSVWASAEHARQMDSLPEMRDRARPEALSVGITFGPIVQFPIDWTAAAALPS